MIRSAITNGPQGLSTGYILLESLDLWYQVELIQHSERHKAPRGNPSLHPLLLLPPFCLSISSLCSRRGILHGFQRKTLVFGFILVLLLFFLEEKITLSLFLPLLPPFPCSTPAPRPTPPDRLFLQYSCPAVFFVHCT